MAKKLCLRRYCGNDGLLETFLACKLIPLHKNPGVRPVGIGEVTKRFLGRAVTTAFTRNILESADDLQLSALSSMFSEDDSNTILLVDADNAFNRINQNVILHNIRIICPIIAT